MELHAVAVSRCLSFCTHVPDMIVVSRNEFQVVDSTDEPATQILYSDSTRESRVRASWLTHQTSSESCPADHTHPIVCIFYIILITYS